MINKLKRKIRNTFNIFSKQEVEERIENLENVIELNKNNFEIINRDVNNKLKILMDFKQIQDQEIENLKKRIDCEALHFLETTEKIANLNENFQNTSQYFGDTLAHHNFHLLELEKKSRKFQVEIEKIDIKRKYQSNETDERIIIIQWVQHFKFGDGIGNAILGIKKILDEAKIENEIWTMDAEYSCEVCEANKIKIYDTKVIPHKKSILLFHFGGEAYLADLLEAYACKKVLVYHNITPAEFFRKDEKFLIESSLHGKQQLNIIKHNIDYCITDSEFNKKELEELGFNTKINVVSTAVVIPNEELRPDLHIIKKLDDGKINILFVGRISPNKKIEDVISAALEYKKLSDFSVRLILVGGFHKEDVYYNELSKMIEQQSSIEILLTGYVSDEELKAYYKVSKLFLCMSEHEGFCVPLIESMYYGLPIIAYNSTAIPGTLGNAGILMNTKDFKEVANMINKVILDEVYRNEIIEKQKKRYLDFSYCNIRDKLMGSLYEIMNIENKEN